MKMKLLLILIAVMLAGCAGNLVVLPKAPYPYGYHEKEKTCTYWLYHKHYEK